MKAIFTKVHGEHRIKATDNDGNTVIVDRALELEHEEQHNAAARQLCARMNWRGTLTKGYVLRAGATVARVYVFTSPDTTITL